MLLVDFGSVEENALMSLCEKGNLLEKGAGSLKIPEMQITQDYNSLEGSPEQ